MSQYQMNSYTILAIFIFVTVFTAGFGYEKKSDFGEFASALNGAGRLRYGKRSEWQEPIADASLRQFRPEMDWNDEVYPYVKRTPATNKLIQSLKGAERLRFGRK